MSLLILASQRTYPNHGFIRSTVPLSLTSKIYGNVSSGLIDGRGGGDSRVTMCKCRRRSPNSSALSRHPFLARTTATALISHELLLVQSTSTAPTKFPRWLNFLNRIHALIPFSRSDPSFDIFLRDFGSIILHLCSQKHPLSSSPLRQSLTFVPLSVKYRKGEERESLQSI